ncbi:hypothetical protein AAGS61_17460 [Lysinibacillus sp. KU-BSD001]|uniref:CD3337/EF1877 family mobilome membrane protein n=1 Tax=Lysinibacillus sp. KU-BSD001 TaxID=3141328 RepID=UPI0036ED6D8F
MIGWINKILICMMVLFCLPMYQVSAEDEMFDANYGEFKNEDIYYDLDIITEKEANDDSEGFLTTVINAFDISNISEGVMEAIYYVFFLLLELAFSFNMFMTNLMISILDFAYDINIVNDLIDSMSGTVIGISGLGDGSITVGGLFGSFGGLIAIIVALYTLYQFVVKRASIGAFSSLLKSIIVFTLALAFFSNYTTFLKGAHTISNEFSALILSGTTGDAVIDETTGVVKSNTIQTQMYDNLFNTFVHKPYLLLQYGRTDVSKERALRLLTLDPQTNEEERKNEVINEIDNEQNNTMLVSSIWKRYNYTGIMIIGNAVASIPVYLLSLSLLLFQVWFLIMAMVAPFVFLWAALPGQFGVLKRYLFEFSLPLVLKSVVSIGALLIFGLTEVIYSLSAIAGGGSKGLVLAIVLQTILIMAMFLLRKRIGGIFTKGSEQLALMREQMHASLIDPAKQGFQNTATAAIGTTVAVATGGAVAPAMLAANATREATKAMTGDVSIGDATKSIATSALGYKMLSDKMAKSNLDINSLNHLQEFSDNEQLDSMQVDALKHQLKDHRLSDVSVEELNDAKTAYLEAYENDNTHGQSMSEYMARHIVKKRNAEATDNLVHHQEQTKVLSSLAGKVEDTRKKQIIVEELGTVGANQFYDTLGDYFNDISLIDMETYVHEHKLYAEQQVQNGSLPKPFTDFVIEKVEYKQLTECLDTNLHANAEKMKQMHLQVRTIEKINQISQQSSSINETRGVVEVKVTEERIQEIYKQYNSYLEHYPTSRTARNSTEPLSRDEFMIQKIKEMVADPNIEAKELSPKN